MKKPAPPAAPPELSAEGKLLIEIRDLLKQKALFFALASHSGHA